MAYSVLVLPSAERELGRLPNKDMVRIMRVIAALGDEPRPRGVQKLRGLVGRYRVRRGNYRILFRVDDATKRVFVYAVGHRKDVYR